MWWLDMFPRLLRVPGGVRVWSGIGYRAAKYRGSISSPKRHFSGHEQHLSQRARNDPRFFKTVIPNNVEYSQRVPGNDDEIVVAMSSGVDSSVCALMYASRFKKVRGIFMANWSPDKVINSNAKCTVDEDWMQVKEICNYLNIPCERVNFEKEYWTQVFEPMLQQYERGLTPNPDIGCNKYVKFGKLVEYLESKFTNGEKWWLVTGHYCRVLKNNKTGESHIFRANYKNKDQSYYLTSVDNNQLQRLLMPIGHYSKPEVREIASDYNLLSKDKPDSQGLCFVSQIGKFKDFLNEYIPPNPGNIVTSDGTVWGKHNGLWSATIGQKSGISMPQGDPRYKGVWLVSGKNIERNELIISRKDDKDAFFKDKINVDISTWYWMDPNMKWNNVKLDGSVNCQVRSLQIPNIVKDIRVKDNVATFTIDEKIFGIAAGQTLALYEDDRLLGSGIMC